MSKEKEIKSIPGRVKGLGIGLSMVKQIITAHGGRIKIGSTIDEGTEIVFTLPDAYLKKEDTKVPVS